MNKSNHKPRRTLALYPLIGVLVLLGAVLFHFFYSAKEVKAADPVDLSLNRSIGAPLKEKVPPAVRHDIDSKLKVMQEALPKSDQGKQSPARVLAYANGLFELYDNVFAEDERKRIFKQALSDQQAFKIIEGLVRNPFTMKDMFPDPKAFATARVFAIDAIVFKASSSGDSGILKEYIDGLAGELNDDGTQASRLRDLGDLVSSYILMKKREFLENPHNVAKDLPCSKAVFQTLLNGIMGGLTQPEFKTPQVEDFYVHAHQYQCDAFSTEKE
ncbi:MAG TPA: hypothetical protein VE954_24670 [Oligoflexus sp.]|uniref:hypothetical protein n=1 Tax=Oligoflexus sp. TaxID=1971216 RepID=UPI002D6E00FC|nr:hypothetical protein [Oligoflexus sp.]HYX36311.1 hypothetical protein [Oligoflexus sp.]